MASTEASATRRALRRAVPFRLALRELRGGLRGFITFIACIALGVMAVAGVGSFSRSLSDGLAHEGRAILGGDIAFVLTQREANAEERAFLARHGAVSETATMRAMARAGNGQAGLVELKAVDGHYPLYGTLKLDGESDLARALAPRGGVFGAAAESALLTRLGIAVGDRVQVGQATFEVRAAIASEPDKLAGGLGFGPRLLTSIDGLRATQLIQPGSLVRWHYRLRLAGNPSDRAVASIVRDADAAGPNAGWEVRTRASASPQLERNIERF
ncbi:MAG: ABC transporter permease, partial [Rhizobiales bacterium]|nr:ABC transporter permease [Hyphomicrobiales bacterium]